MYFEARIALLVSADGDIPAPSATRHGLTAQRSASHGPHDDRRTRGLYRSFIQGRTTLNGQASRRCFTFAGDALEPAEDEVELCP
jgi:hypothetical protein